MYRNEMVSSFCLIESRDLVMGADIANPLLIIRLSVRIRETDNEARRIPTIHISYFVS